jgi:signal transduction histidine kinase
LERKLTLSRAEGVRTVLARTSALTLPEWTGRAGETAGRLLVLTDITALTHTIQMKSDFVANASHELRTPLSAISGAVETLLTMDLAQDAGAATRLIGVVERQAARLSALVADLLDLSRVEAAGAKFAPARVVLEDVFRELGERFGARLAAKRLHWETTIAPGASVLLVNRELFVLVLDNLVDNAIKFTAEEGRIAVAARRAEDGACGVSVADNGCGIPLPEQDRVFERFYQVERARTGGAQRGTGLGLAIVRHAVIAMGGKIVLDSAPGAGTRLEVFIPQPGAGVSAGEAAGRAVVQHSPAAGTPR